MIETKNRIRDWIKENWIWLIGIFLLLIYVYWDVIAGEWKISYSNLLYKMKPWDSMDVKIKGPVLSDIMDNLLPTIYSVFRSGDGFHFWNSEIGMGAPEDISILLYPFYLLYLFPVDWAVLLKSILQIAIAFFSMYMLLREWKCKRFSAAMSGLIYTFSSSMVCWGGWPHSDVTMFAPFTFLLVSRIIQELKIRYALWLAAVLYLMLVAGMPTFAAYFLYLLGIWMVGAAICRYRKDIKKITAVFGLFSLAVVLGVMMSLPYTAQLLLSVGGNGYVSSRTIQGKLTLEPSYLFLTFFPDWNVVTRRHFNECAIYVGIAGLWMLLFSGIRIRQKKQSWFWIGAWGILVMLIFTHSLDFIFTRLPAVNTSVKFRVIVLLNFVTAILCGFQLQDILDNREYYKKHWYNLIFMLFFMLAAWHFAADYYLAQGVEGAMGKVWIVFAEICLLGIVLFSYLWSGKKMLLALLCAIAVYDLGGFARSYFPLVEKGAVSIPEATDSIQFLQEHTQNGERFSAEGTWVFFPNMNIFYDLKDIRSHNFINTNRDLTRLYTSMDPWFYTTPTRTAIWRVENYTILKYLGVKYLATSHENQLVDYMEEIQDSGVVGPMINSIPVTQTFLAQDNNMTAITIQVATYGNIFEPGEDLTLILTNAYGRELARETYPLSEIADNSSVRMTFPAIKNSYNKKYELRIENSAKEIGQAVSVWRGADQYEGELFYESIQPGYDLMLEVEFIPEHTDLVYSGEDGLYIHQTREWAERFVLSEEAYIGVEEDTVLSWMIAEYYPNAVLLSESYYGGSKAEAALKERERVIPSSIEDFPNYKQLNFSKLHATEGWNVISDSDDRIEVSVTVEEPRFFMLNEYYDEEWKVYVDGEEQELLKANYAMRAVYLSTPGEYTVIFQYEPDSSHRLIIMAIIGAVAFFFIWIARKKIQQKIDRVCR